MDDEGEILDILVQRRRDVRETKVDVGVVGSAILARAAAAGKSI